MSAYALLLITAVGLIALVSVAANWWQAGVIAELSARCARHGARSFPPAEIADCGRRMPQPLETAEATGGAPGLSGPGAAPGTYGGLLAGPERFACCPCCAAGSPCDPPNRHPAPCDDGCNTGAQVPPAAQAHADAVHRSSVPYLPPAPPDLPKRPKPGTLAAQKAPVTRTPDAPPWETTTGTQPALSPEAEEMRGLYQDSYAAERGEVARDLQSFPGAPLEARFIA